MIDPRRPRKAHLADDLQIHVQRRVRVAPRFERERGPCTGARCHAGLFAIAVPGLGGCVTIDLSSGVAFVSLLTSGTGRRSAGIAANACSSACEAPSTARSARNGPMTWRPKGMPL